MDSSPNAQYKLPLWYYPGFVLPFALILLVLLGMVFTLPPNVIDPRKYPAFMDGGEDWGGSNIFFYSRVVMLLMGFLGFLSLGYLKPAPDWEKIPSKTRLVLFQFKSHLLCFFFYFILVLLDRDSMGFVNWLEMFCWYISSAYFGVLLLSKGASRGIYQLSGIVSFILLVFGFYCGFWLTGAEFQADAIPFWKLLIRLFIQMAVYIVGMSIWSSAITRTQQSLSTVN
ncbi:MAG: hypothetical protein PHI84_02250 [Kiritimatiellae bacterium]|nr:hypothetical protein [Kiritimatiellia bacterium]